MLHISRSAPTACTTSPRAATNTAAPTAKRIGHGLGRTGSVTPAPEAPAHRHPGRAWTPRLGSFSIPFLPTVGVR